MLILYLVSTVTPQSSGSSFTTTMICPLTEGMYIAEHESLFPRITFYKRSSFPL